MRWLLVGAFPYPHHQGSQVYLREQARALRTAGVEVELLTYASSGRTESSDPVAESIPHHHPPRWTAPHSIASGPDLAKPLADLALSMTLRRLVASSLRQDRPYDAVLTHNVEATLAALTALPRRPRPALVYCAHTLLEAELPHYLPTRWRPKSLQFIDHVGSPGQIEGRLTGLPGRVTRRIGSTLDRCAARHTDGWLALTQSAHRVMKDDASGPGSRIGPPIPDLRERLPREEIESTLQRHGLERGGYVLYTGNLDGYQALDQLRAPAPPASPSRAPAPRVVVASHDPAVRAPGRLAAGIAGRWVRDDREMLALLAGARASVVPRTAPGGYPIKLGNSLALGVPPISLLAEEWGLTHGVSAWVASGPNAAIAIEQAIARLLADHELATRLARGARALYERSLAPGHVAQKTIALVEEVIAASRLGADRTVQIEG
jgi:glycosyltransferase involved in cell wall biosynthesis